MLNFGRGFEVLGVHCFAVPGQDLRFHYLPLTADCQRGADGRPQAHLLTAGDTAFLQLATVWDVPSARLEQVRGELAALAGVEPALVQLAFAPVTVEAVRLLGGDGAAADVELVVTRSSGIAPHSAMFNLPLRGADRDRAMAAFNGRSGFLQVRYQASMPAPVRHEARLTGDLSSVMTVGELEAALADGRAQLALDPTDAELRDAFVLRAVEILRLLQPEPGSAGEVAIEIVVDETVALGVATDIGGWFEGGIGVTPVPGSGFDPAPGPKDRMAVSLDLAGAEGVVAEVEVRTGGGQARLVAPAFAAAALPRDGSGAPVQVRTRYVGGGEVFAAERPVPAEGPLALVADDLGVIEITLDASPLEARGLERLRTTLRYRPEGPGERDERTFHLRAPPFSARWLVVSRGEPLGASLTYDLRATLTSGENVDHRPVVANSPTITLAANPEE